MKKIFVLFAMVALTGAYAKAEDKSTEFKFGGEFRERFYWDNNPTMLGSNGTSEMHFQQREQFHVNAIASDKLQAYFNMLHYNIWGGSGVLGAANMIPTTGQPYPGTATGVGVPSAAGTANMSALQVHEAWMWWKVTDMLSFKFGRMTANYGDGFLLAKNDWLAAPYNFDGLMGRLSWDFLDLDFGGAKIVDAGVTSPTTPTATGTNNTDTETNIYAIYASVKNLPDVLKTADLAIVQINSDIPGATTFAPSVKGTGTAGAWNLMTIGLHLKGEASIIDYRADAAFQSGKQKNGAGAGSDLTIGGNMYDLEVGVNFPEFMKGRAFIGYHADTGDDGTDITKNTTYQPLFYDIHNNSGGLMNVVGWGNQTNIRVGLTVNPEETCTFGLAFDMFSRTNTKAGTVMLNPNQGNMFIAATSAASTDSAVATEIDLWAKHNYGHGLVSLLQLGYFTPGNSLKATGGSYGSGLQLAAQAQYNF